MSSDWEICFVYSKDALKIKKFLDTVPRAIECVNYIDIHNKLTKNDYLQLEPSDAILSSHLVKKLQSIINKSKSFSMYYVLSSLEEDSINNIKNYIQSLIHKSAHYKIYYTEDVDINQYSFLFNETILF